MNGLVRRRQQHDDRAGAVVGLSSSSALKNHGKECINLFLEVRKRSARASMRAAAYRPGLLVA